MCNSVSGFQHQYVELGLAFFACWVVAVCCLGDLQLFLVPHCLLANRTFMWCWIVVLVLYIG